MRYTREQACLAWLAQGMLGSRRLKKLLDEYGSAEAAYDAFQRDNGASLQNRISDYSLSLLRASASREKLHDMLVTMRKWNMGLVSMADDMFAVHASSSWRRKSQKHQGLYLEAKS